MQLAREHPEMDHPLLAAYRVPDYAPSVAAKASAAQRLYDALPPVCPDCGNADAEVLSPGTTYRAPSRAAWVCSNEESCLERQEAATAQVA
jgi:hypothetical protein